MRRSGDGTEAGMGETAAKLLERKAMLEERLEIGRQRIDEVAAKGYDTERWEGFWMALLGGYDEVLEQLEQLEQQP